MPKMIIYRSSGLLLQTLEVVVHLVAAKQFLLQDWILRDTLDYCFSRSEQSRLSGGLSDS